MDKTFLEKTFGTGSYSRRTPSNNIQVKVFNNGGGWEGLLRDPKVDYMFFSCNAMNPVREIMADLIDGGAPRPYVIICRTHDHPSQAHGDTANTRIAKWLARHRDTMIDTDNPFIDEIASHQCNQKSDWKLGQIWDPSKD